MNIGKVSELTGLNRKSIRDYEKSGLTATARRNESGCRRYTTRDLDTLSFIKHARCNGDANPTARLSIPCRQTAAKKKSDRRIQGRLKMDAAEVNEVCGARFQTTFFADGRRGKWQQPVPFSGKYLS